MKYYIIATRVNLSGYPETFTIGYDNEATSDYDNFMFFETEAEAQEWTKSKQAEEWKDCTFEVIESVKKYSGYGYHGGGRKPLPEEQKKKYVTISVSGQPEEIERLKSRAQEENKTVSRFILDNIK